LESADGLWVVAALGLSLSYCRDRANCMDRWMNAVRSPRKHARWAIAGGV